MDISDDLKNEILLESSKLGAAEVPLGLSVQKHGNREATLFRCFYSSV
jgi:hypothetical protein